MRRQYFLITALWLLLSATSFSALAQQTAPQAPAESPLLTVDSLFTFRSRGLGPIQWQQDGNAYLALERSAAKKDSLDIVRYDAVTGERTIKVSAEKLMPAGASTPLGVEDFVLSPDEQKLLIFTNSERVWRGNTRGDYWVVDPKTWDLRKLGGPDALCARKQYLP